MVSSGSSSVPIFTEHNDEHNAEYNAESDFYDDDKEWDKSKQLLVS